MVISFHCIIIFSILRPTYGDFNFTNTSENHTNINEILERLANEIVQKYFAQNRCMVVLSETGFLKNIKAPNTVTYLEIDSENENCHLLVHDYLKDTFVDNCDGYIVQLKNATCGLKGWEETYKRKFVPRHNPKFFFLPVYPNTLTYADDLMTMRISDISQNILAAELAANESDWTVMLWTNNFYQHPEISGRQPKLLLDEWHYSKGFKENVDLYPDKILDLKGKKIRVSTGKYIPFSLVEPLDGMENRIAIQFCEKHNCTWTGLDDEYYWGTIYDNLTGNGVIGNVYIDKSDIGAMAVYLWLDESYYVDYTTSYLAGDVTVMVPKPTKLGGWIVPFLPFGLDMWVAFFMMLFISALSLYSITRASIKYTRFGEILVRKVQFTTIGDSIMRAIGLAVLQQPSSRLIGDSPNRYLFTSFEFVYLVLSAMYSAELASFLTIPLYNPPIDTFHGFAHSGIKWYGTHEAWTYALKTSPDEDAKLIVNHFQVLPMDQLKEAAKLGKYGFTAERLPGGSITEQDHITAEVIPLYHIMKEKLFGSPLVAAIKKGGPYTKYYNNIISRMVQYGFTLYWEAETARRYLNSRIQAEYNEAKTIHIDSSPAVIQVSHIEGVLYLYSIGIIISFLVFFIELVKTPDRSSKLFEMINAKEK